MSPVETLGFVGAFLTTISGLPQFFKIMRDKSAKEVSLWTYIILLVGVICWLVYGFFLNSKPLIFANSITLIIYTCILASKIYYSKRI
jgi:MtN3 and saliva related transmembrane protein